MKINQGGGEEENFHGKEEKKIESGVFFLLSFV